MKTPAGMPLAAPHATADRRPDRIVLVLQGGGALGAYQVGVYEALHEAGIEPDWIIGTSIGAINASLIAGNRREDRLARLDDFWRRVAYGPGQRLAHGLPFGGAQLATWMTIAAGVDAFFAPNILAFAGPQHPLGADRAGYYSTDMLRKTLGELVDFDLINRGGCRLTVGAANVRTAQMHYFDSRDMPFEASHIMASGALPPAFPPVRIGGDLYWDGGILSNTPVEAVFDDNPRRSSLIFAVHLWNPHGPEPATMAEVANRQKDVQYASRAHSHIVRQQQIHRLRHIVAELAARLPKEERETAAVRELAGYGCLTQMHVVRLLAPTLAGENQFKDGDFSPDGIAARRRSGYDNTRAVLARAPWTAEVDPLQGFILHEAHGGEMTREA
jgi:NTE family protein